MVTLAQRDPVTEQWPDLWRRFFAVPPEAEGWLRVEEKREGDDYVVRFEVPGIDPERDVELTVTGGVLRISARREQRVERDEQGERRSEFRYGEFTRAIPLPQGVDPDSITADYKDGILEVRVPLPQEEKSEAKRIPVGHN
jgi:HSP20 family protein